MKVTKYGRHLIMITQYHSINCFLVIEEDGLTLVDALIRGAGPAILDVIAETELPLRRIVLSRLPNLATSVPIPASSAMRISTRRGTRRFTVR